MCCTHFPARSNIPFKLTTFFYRIILHQLLPLPSQIKVMYLSKFQLQYLRPSSSSVPPIRVRAAMLPSLHVPSLLLRHTSSRAYRTTNCWHNSSIVIAGLVFIAVSEGLKGESETHFVWSRGGFVLCAFFLYEV